MLSSAELILSHGLVFMSLYGHARSWTPARSTLICASGTFPTAWPTLRAAACARPALSDSVPAWRKHPRS